MKKEPLPTLLECDRIYLDVPYMGRNYAKYCNCGFNSNKKLWFTGVHNSNLYSLIKLYGVSGATSDKANQLLKEKMEVIYSDISYDFM